MKTPEQWKVMEQEVEELEELRAVISNRIHLLKVKLAQHKKTTQNSTAGMNSIAYQMFGKRLKDLTPDEYRQYYNARQRENRAKRRKQNDNHNKRTARYR